MAPRPKPGQPGNSRPLPEKPKPLPRVIDPKHNGDGSAAKPPTHGENNRPITQKPLTGPGGRTISPRHEHITIINNKIHITNINRIHNSWNHNDHGYGWYNWDGHHICHHYDTFGYHWWGWYIGSSYFWTRYYADRYWWYDPYWGRWVYLHDNRWWWQDPYRVNVIYLYSHEDSRYYQYDSSHGGVVITPDPTPPVVEPPDDPTPTPAPTPDQTPVTVYSKDGSRMIQIFGAEKNAYLYDPSETPAFEPVWLGSGIDEIRWRYAKSTAEDGSEIETLSEILALKTDESYDRFTPDGFLIAEPAEPQEPQDPAPSSPAGGSTDASLLQKSGSFKALGELGRMNFDGSR